MDKNNMQRGFLTIKTIGIVIAFVVLVIIFGYFVLSDEKTNPIDIKDTKTNIQNNTPEVQSEAPVNEIQVNDQKTAQKPAKPSVGYYEDYSLEKLAMAETGDVVLFFYAAWCPSCRGLDSDILKNVNSIPAGVTILKTNYDKETALKKKYGVTYQHTLVKVDKDGNLIKKWSGGSSLANLISQIQ